MVTSRLWCEMKYKMFNSIEKKMRGVTSGSTSNVGDQIIKDSYLPHEVMAHSPHVYIVYGIEPKGIPTAFPRIKAPAVESRLTELMKIRQEALAAHELARQMMIQRNPEKEVKFSVGDQVWLEAKNLKFPSETPKFKPKRLGPFRITRKIGKMNYELKLPFQWKNHPVFHTTLLTPYRETKEHGPNYIKPPPDLIDGQEEY